MALIHSPRLDTTPLFMQTLAGDDQINYSAKEFRQLITSTWPTDGVLGAVSFHVTQADTVGWAIKVSSGAAKLGSGNAGTTTSGGYLVVNTDAITIPMTSIQTQVIAPQTHGVYLVVQDKTVYGDGYYAEVVVGTDEGAGRTVPDGAAVLWLAAVNVSPGQTNIQNQHIVWKPPHASFQYRPIKLADEALTSAYISASDTLSEVAEARARYGAGRVWFSGGIRKKGGGTFAAGSENIIGTMPYYMRPFEKAWVLGASGGDDASIHWRLTVDPDGTMRAQIPAGQTPTTLFLDGVSYEID